QNRRYDLNAQARHEQGVSVGWARGDQARSDGHAILSLMRLDRYRLTQSARKGGGKRASHDVRCAAARGADYQSKRVLWKFCWRHRCMVLLAGGTRRVQTAGQM